MHSQSGIGATERDEKYIDAIHHNPAPSTNHFQLRKNQRIEYTIRDSRRSLDIPSDTFIAVRIHGLDEHGSAAGGETDTFSPAEEEELLHRHSLDQLLHHQDRRIVRGIGNVGIDINPLLQQRVVYLIDEKIKEKISLSQKPDCFIVQLGGSFCC